jgi:hypothetical protein
VLIIAGMQRLLVRIPLVTFHLPFLFWISGGCTLSCLGIYKSPPCPLTWSFAKDLLGLVPCWGRRHGDTCLGPNVKACARGGVEGGATAAVFGRRASPREGVEGETAAAGLFRRRALTDVLGRRPNSNALVAATQPWYFLYALCLYLSI